MGITNFGFVLLCKKVIPNLKNKPILVFFFYVLKCRNSELLQILGVRRSKFYTSCTHAKGTHSGAHPQHSAGMFPFHCTMVPYSRPMTTHGVHDSRYITCCLCSHECCLKCTPSIHFSTAIQRNAIVIFYI